MRPDIAVVNNNDVICVIQPGPAILNFPCGKKKAK